MQHIFAPCITIVSLNCYALCVLRTMQCMCESPVCIPHLTRWKRRSKNSGMWCEHCLLKPFLAEQSCSTSAFGHMAP